MIIAEFSILFLLLIILINLTLLLIIRPKFFIFIIVITTMTFQNILKKSSAVNANHKIKLYPICKKLKKFCEKKQLRLCLFFLITVVSIWLGGLTYAIKQLNNLVIR